MILIFGIALILGFTTCSDSGVGDGDDYNPENPGTGNPVNGNPVNPGMPINPSAPITYTVTYNGNGNTGGVVPANSTIYNGGATVTVLGNTGDFVKTGYTFAGWNTDPGGTGSAYTTGNTFVISANTILYAQWLKNAYGITLSINDRDVTSSTHVFLYAMLGYGVQAARTVTVTNTSDQPTGNLTITSNNPGSFSLSQSSIGSVAIGSIGTFTIVPRTGLAAGSHSATITITGNGGITASFIVRFDIAPASWYSSNPDGPYTITTAAELAELAQIINGTHGSIASGIINRNNFNGKTVNLANDINLSTYGASCNGGKGWIPIEGFSGTFDGNGKKITNLYINDMSGTPLGLFGSISGGTVQNLGVEDVDITGTDYVGGVVGIVMNWIGYTRGTVKNCYSTGTVTGGTTTSSNMVGGVVGYGGTVENCYSTATVIGIGWVGGVVGCGDLVNNCYSTGTVTGTNSNNNLSESVGGVVGYAGTVKNCYSTATVIGEYINYIVGGVVGHGESVTNCYSTGNVSGFYAGGVVGIIYFMSDTSMVQYCYSAGNVSGTCVGGVVGYSSVATTVKNCYSTGNVNGTDSIGGVVGRGSGDITVENCYSTGNINGGGVFDYVGGVVGYIINGTIVNCYSTGFVSGGGNNYCNIGGVAGLLNTGQNCVALNPSVTGSGYDYIHIGRVVGYYTIPASNLENNYARSNMIAGGTAFPTGNGTTHQNGADITSTQWNSASWWTGTAQFSTSEWNISNDSLPTLKNMPAGTQNPVVKN